MDVAVSLGAAALILGVIGFVRAVAEFGTPGVIAFAKLVLAPVGIIVFLFISGPATYGGKFPRSLLPSSEALKIILICVLAFTGIAFALSAVFGVAWLVTK